jgi:hypothetical protein
MNNVSEKIKLYFRKRKHRISISGVSVRADWALIISITSLLIVSGAVWAGFLYKGIASGTAFESSESEDVPDTEHKKNEIAKTVEYLRGN